MHSGWKGLPKIGFWALLTIRTPNLMLQILNPRSSVFEGGSSSRIGMSTCCMSSKWAFVKAFLACLNGTISLTVHISQQSCVVYFFVGNMVLQ